MQISLIVAADMNNAIGFKNSLPWYIPEDMKYFKEKTLGNIVIMGSRTLTSIGGPLKDRDNIVLTSQFLTLENDVIHRVMSVKEAILKARELLGDREEVFVIGGSRVYNEFMPVADNIYLTRVHEEVHADSYFPDIDKNIWDLTSEKSILSKEGIKLSFQVFERNTLP